MISVDRKFPNDIGNVYINIETFIGLEHFKLIKCVITVFRK
jgi:hypothetical protein